MTHFSFGPTDIPRWVRDDFEPMQYDDYEYVRKNVGGIDAVAYTIFGSNETVRYQSESAERVTIVPASQGTSEINDFKMDKGRFYTEVESNSGSPVVVLGYSLAESLFDNINPIGKKIRIYGRKLTVIGVLEKVGVSFGDSPDDQAVLPVNFVRSLVNTGKNGLPGAIIIKPEKDIDVDAFESVLKQKFRGYRGLKADEVDDFFVSKVAGFVDLIDGIISGMNLIGWMISFFSLLVGGFGIANIMFVSVKERTNLIGIQKSLGAKNRFILFQFLFEAVILAVVGGLVGLGLVGLIAAISSSFTGDFKFVLSFTNMAIGFGLSTFIGLISGVIPAISASRLDPVEAIRTGM